MNNINRYKRFFKFKSMLLFTFVFLDILFIIIEPLIYMPEELYFLNIFDKTTCFLLFLDLMLSYKQNGNDFIKNHIFEIISIIPVGTRYFRLFAGVRLIWLIYTYLTPKNAKYKGNKRKMIINDMLLSTSVFTLIYFIIVTLFLTLYDKSFGNLFDGIWFNLVTFSSVGYGDVIPNGLIGKFTATLSVIIGALAISIFTSYLSAAYNQRAANQKRQLILDYVESLDNNTKSLEKHFSKLDNGINSLEKDIDKLNDRLIDLNDSQKQ